MSGPVQVHVGKLAWSGDHWILGIRQQGVQQPTAWVRLFHTRYCLLVKGSLHRFLFPVTGHSASFARTGPKWGGLPKSSFSLPAVILTRTRRWSWLHR